MTAPEDDAADAARIPNAAAARQAAAQDGRMVEPGADPAPAEPPVMSRETPPRSAERSGGRQER